MKYSTALQYYGMNPIKCYQKILEQNTSKDDDVGSLILIALYSIDEVIRRRENIKYNFYIQDVDSIYFILSKTNVCVLTKNRFDQCIFELDFSKLIYKFTCAKKFCISDDSICQLRINSWGRSFIDEKNLLAKYAHEYNVISQFIDEYLTENGRDYHDLANLLLGLIDRKAAAMIEQINLKLGIKLLS